VTPSAAACVLSSPGERVPARARGLAACSPLSARVGGLGGLHGVAGCSGLACGEALRRCPRRTQPRVSAVPSPVRPRSLAAHSAARAARPSGPDLPPHRAQQQQQQLCLGSGAAARSHECSPCHARASLTPHMTRAPSAPRRPPRPQSMVLRPLRHSASSMPQAPQPRSLTLREYYAQLFRPAFPPNEPCPGEARRMGPRGWALGAARSTCRAGVAARLESQLYLSGWTRVQLKTLRLWPRLTLRSQRLSDEQRFPSQSEHDSHTCACHEHHT
jgi:hypothetical protein